MFGAIDFYGAARDRELNPIIGFEAYVSSKSRRDRVGRCLSPHTAGRGLYRLQQPDAVDDQGAPRGLLSKARVDHEFLQQHSERVICLSGCASSEICRAILDGNSTRPTNSSTGTTRLQDRFFLELQDHGLDFQAGLNQALIDFSKSMGIPTGGHQ